MRYKQKLMEVEAVRFDGTKQSEDKIRKLSPKTKFSDWQLSSLPPMLYWGIEAHQFATEGEYVVKKQDGELVSYPQEIFEDMFEMVLEDKEEPRHMTPEEIDSTIQLEIYRRFAEQEPTTSVTCFL